MGCAGVVGPWQNRRGAGGPECCLANGRYDGWGLPGTRLAIGCLGGSRADPLAGRLRWGGAGRPRRSHRARQRRGPGRETGPLGGLGGSYLGLRRGGHHSPLLFARSHLPPAAPGPGRRRQQRLRPPRVGRFREGGPSSLRVWESGRRASPALSERIRPARAGTSPAAPRPESTRRTAASAAVAASAGAGAGAAGASAAASHSPCGTLNSHRQPPPSPRPLRPARPRPRARGPAPRDSPAAEEQARAHLPPTPPTACGSRPACCPSPRTWRRQRVTQALARARPIRPPQAAPPKLFFLTLRQSSEPCLRISLQ